MKWVDFIEKISEFGVRSVHVKKLSPNDNSKNQVYLGRTKGIIPLIPKSDTV